MDEQLAIGLAGSALAAAHLFGARLRILDVVARRTWLSAAGGISVAYVFVHLLPEVAAEARELLAGERGGWLLVMVGFAFFYVVEHVALASRADPPDRTEAAPETHPSVFWLSITSFALYNAVVGYLLRERAAAGLGALAIYAVALGVHFLVNDISLREHHRHRYDRVGRWALAASVVVGAGSGILVEVPAPVVAAAIALLAGAIILNVMKEELPGEQKARVGAFLAGLVPYALLVAIAG